MAEGSTVPATSRSTKACSAVNSSASSGTRNNGNAAAADARVWSACRRFMLARCYAKIGLAYLHVVDFVLAFNDIADDEAVGLAGLEETLAHGIGVFRGHDEDHADAHVEGAA